MTIIGNLDEIELPSGSEQKTIDYDGQEISAATKFGLDLVYLTDENGENGAFYIYSEGKFMPYVEIDQTGTYTILPLPDSEELPQGLIASQLTIDNTSVQGWIDAESNYIVYAVDDEGNKGFYTYNFSEGRLIKYIPSTSAAASPEPSSEAEPTSSAEGSSVEVNADVDSKPKSMLEKLTSDMMFTAAVGGLAILIVVMLIVFICIVSNKKTPDDIEAGKHGRD